MQPRVDETNYVIKIWLKIYISKPYKSIYAITWHKEDNIEFVLNGKLKHFNMVNHHILRSSYRMRLNHVEIKKKVDRSERKYIFLWMKAAN